MQYLSDPERVCNFCGLGFNIMRQIMWSYYKNEISISYYIRSDHENSCLRKLTEKQTEMFRA